MQRRDKDAGQRRRHLEAQALSRDERAVEADC